MANSIIDIATRHQVLLERLKAGKIRDYKKVVKWFERDLIAKANSLGVNSLNELTKKELNSLISYSTKLSKKYQTVAVDDLTKDLSKLAKDDALFERDAIKSVAKGVAVNSAANIAYAAALASPISATGELLEPFIKNWSQTRINQVNGVIRKGYKEGQTLSQMTQAIRGTRANNFKDGLTALRTRQAEAVIRTSVQHVSATARMQTWEANRDIIEAYKWRSTLDGRTTQRCRSLDGLEFEMGRGPMPPIHINCRSTINFVLDSSLGLDALDKGATRSALGGEVSAKQTYYDWLKKQPKGFQEQAIGVQRTKWLTDGKLTSKQFAALNLDKNFNPLTLAQMKAKRSSIISNKYGTTTTKKTTKTATKTATKKTARKSAQIQPNTSRGIAFPKPPKPAVIIPNNDIDVIKSDTSKIMKGVVVKKNTKALDEAVDILDKENAVLVDLDKKYNKAKDRVLKNALADKFNEQAAIVRKLIVVRNAEIAKIKAVTQKTDDQLKATIFKKRHDEKLNTLKVLRGNVENKARLAQAQELLENVLSADNLKAIKNNNRLTTAKFSRARDFRAHYKRGASTIYLRSDESVSVMLHEMMHSLEYSRPEVSKRSKAFLAKRGAGERPQRLRELTGNPNYLYSEIALEDEFKKRGGSHYMGKIYDRESTEILTMGVERLLGDPTNFYLEDREYFDFMIEILNL